MKNMSNIKKIILFKTIMQETTLNRTRDNDDYNHSQSKNNKFFEHQFNRNQQSNKSCYFNNSEKKEKVRKQFRSISEKQTHACRNEK